MRWQWMQTKAWLLARIAYNQADGFELVAEHSLCSMKMDKWTLKPSVPERACRLLSAPYR
jgi:hypothetical protein